MPPRGVPARSPASAKGATSCQPGATPQENVPARQTASGKESGGVTNRLSEQLGYAYDPAGNLICRTNNASVQIFIQNSLNQVTNIARSGTLTMVGDTAIPATNVTVNMSNAVIYADNTFASTNQALVDGSNTFTAIAFDSYGHSDTNTVSVYLPATVTNQFDANGNLIFDGRRHFEYDDENQLITVCVTNEWKSGFVYDGKMRRRIRTEAAWSGSTWVTNTTVRYVFDGNLVIQERDGGNAPVASYTRGKDLSGSMEGAGGIGGLLAFTQHGSIYPIQQK